MDVRKTLSNRSKGRVALKDLDKSRPPQQDENSQKSKQEEKNQKSRISRLVTVSGTS
ncbi:hypothetical protein ACRRTK_018952 [Alexandromys fortis]